VANVQDGYVDTSDLKTVRVLRSEVDRYRLEPGDVLLTEGGDFDKLGRGAVWNGSIADCLHQNHIFRVRFHDAVIPEYFALYIASSVGRSYFLSCAKQTTNLASINKTQLSAMPVAYPPVDEQRRIVSPLNQLAMRLTLEERRRRKLELIHRGLMDDLLTGRARLLVTGGGRS
jgi:type I restriction enzyme S subunit